MIDRRQAGRLTLPALVSLCCIAAGVAFALPPTQQQDPPGEDVWDTDIAGGTCEQAAGCTDVVATQDSNGDCGLMQCTGTGVTFRHCKKDPDGGLCVQAKGLGDTVVTCSSYRSWSCPKVNRTCDVGSCPIDGEGFYVGDYRYVSGC